MLRMKGYAGLQQLGPDASVHSQSVQSSEWQEGVSWVKLCAFLVLCFVWWSVSYNPAVKERPAHARSGPQPLLNAPYVGVQQLKIYELSVYPRVEFISSWGLLSYWGWLSVIAPTAYITTWYSRVRGTGDASERFQAGRAPYINDHI